jgi:hypothetical protein
MTKQSVEAMLDKLEEVLTGLAITERLEQGTLVLRTSASEVLD